MNDTISVLHPSIEKVAGSVSSEAASRSAPMRSESALRGMRLALLDNTKVNADALLKAVGRRLEARGIGPISNWRKRHAGDSGADVIAEMLKWKPDLVLTGLGD